MAAAKDICVVGLGPVGLATSVTFASKGFEVVGVDMDSKRLEELRRGKPPFSEKGMKQMLGKTLNDGLEVTGDITGGVKGADMTFITVGTPAGMDGAIDLTQVKRVSVSIGEALRGTSGKLIVVKSTVVPGTARGLVRPTIARHSRGAEFWLASNPEFLREGSMVEDTMQPDRVVIGSDDGSGERLAAAYSTFYGDRKPVIVMTNTVNAEMIKYASNAFLATKVSFINEIANLCGAIPGADVAEVVKGMSHDRRIGGLFLKAGLGFGGSCFPKDLQALVALGESQGIDMPVVGGAFSTNSQQALVAVALAKGLVGNLRGKRFAVLGLSFKPGTDDIRGAVSVPLIRRLLKEGSSVTAYDPEATDRAKKVLGSEVLYAASIPACLKGADCCVLVTEWDEFKKLTPEDFDVMKVPALVDGRRIFDPLVFGPRMKFAAVGLGNISR